LKKLVVSKTMKTLVSFWESLISKVGLSLAAPEGNENALPSDEELGSITHAGLTYDSLKIKNHKQRSGTKYNSCSRLHITSQSMVCPVEKASSPGQQKRGNTVNISSVSDRKRRREGAIDLRSSNTWENSGTKCFSNLSSVRTSNFRIRLYYQLNVLKRNSLLSSHQNIQFSSYPITPTMCVERSKPTALPERRIDSVFRKSDMKFQNVVTNKTVDNEEIFVLEI